ncbi:CHRD domain-containing protein [soil metagenome]
MPSRRLTGFVAGTGLFAMAMFASVAPASAARNFFDIDMTGSAEAPGPGDPDGSGTALVALFPEEGRICYVLEVEGIAPATAAHIHEAPAGSPGPVVLPLEAPTKGRSRECRSIAPELAQEILDNPSDYYVNVHNPEHPGGAVRGQLA